MAESAKRSKMSGEKRKDLLFYILMMIFPIGQFSIFYIGVNFNSFLLSFQKIDLLSGNITWTFDNISNAFEDLTSSASMLPLLKTSVLSYLLLLVIGTPLGVLFSFYIYKKLPFSNGFRVILFLPSIISAIVMVTIFQFFVERAIPAFALKLFDVQIRGLMENIGTRYATIMFYNIWVGFGTGVLMYSNGMSGISPDIVESAHLDGAEGIREFWYITLPLIYPTLSTFLITGVAGIFTNQINLYSFYGAAAPVGVQTYGYYLYMQTQLVQSMSAEAEYPPLAAMGLLMTYVAVPLTMLVKWALEKYGPQQE